MPPVISTLFPSPRVRGDPPSVPTGNTKLIYFCELNGSPGPHFSDSQVSEHLKRERELCDLFASAAFEGNASWRSLHFAEEYVSKPSSTSTAVAGRMCVCDSGAGQGGW